jgi:hypothetical protein
MVFKEIFTVYSENHMKPIPSGQNVALIFKADDMYSYHQAL